MQGYFLGKALGPKAVSLYGEATGEVNVPGCGVGTWKRFFS
jgi:hypothetical protein